VHGRGRKRHRITPTLVCRTIGEKRSLVHQVPPSGLSLSGVRKRFGRALTWWIAQTPPPAVPPGRLVLLLDAVWCTFAHRKWTLYLMAFKPVDEAKAYFVDPILLPGRESAHAWRQVLSTLPPDVACRIEAVVTDGFRGSHTLARHRGWVHQRCHFHLIAQLQGRRGQYTRLPTAPVREAIYQAARRALVTRSPRQLTRRCRELAASAQQADCPTRVRMIARDFLRHLGAFRAYQSYPQLHLPTTTNVVESMVRRLRDRVRSLRTPASLHRWAVATIRLHPILTCNGHENQPD